MSDPSLLRITSLSPEAQRALAERSREVADEVDALLATAADVPAGTDAARAFADFREHVRARVTALLGVRCFGALVRALRLDHAGVAMLDQTGWVADVVVDGRGNLQEQYEDAGTDQDRLDLRAARVLAALAEPERSRRLGPEQAAYVAVLRERLDANPRPPGEVRMDHDGSEFEVGPGAGPWSATEQEVRTLEHLLVATEPGMSEMDSEESREAIFRHELARARAVAAALRDHPALSAFDRSFLAELLAREDELVHRGIAELNRIEARCADHDEALAARAAAAEVLAALDGGAAPEELGVFPAELEVCRAVAALPPDEDVDHVQRADVFRARSRFEVEA